MACHELTVNVVIIAGCVCRCFVRCGGAIFFTTHSESDASRPSCFDIVSQACSATHAWRLRAIHLLLWLTFRLGTGHENIVFPRRRHGQCPFGLDVASGAVYESMPATGTVSFRNRMSQDLYRICGNIRPQASVGATVKSFDT